MGRALALQLAEEGAKLSLCDINAQSLAETSRMLGEHHHLTQTMDVSDPDAMAAFAQKTADTFKCVHGVINNAGISIISTFSDMPRQEFERVMQINFFAVVEGCRAFLPLIAATDRGWIVNISSMFGFFAYPSQSAYNASKFAVRGFTECLRIELAQQHPHIHVACVLPGGVQTNVIKSAKLISTLDGEMNREAIDKLFDDLAPTSAKKAAQTIIDGMRRGKRRILIGGDCKLYDLLVRLFPDKYWAVMNFLSSSSGRNE